MNTISNILKQKHDSRNCALIPFITAGYPDINVTLEVLYRLDDKGADIIELGIPYADALADGPIIQESSKVALKQEVYIDDILKILEKSASSLKAPIIIFTYYNPILVRGISKFIFEIYLKGAKGLIIPDLPLEEIDYLLSLCNLYDVELILFVAMTSSKNRISKILSKSSNCIYLVSRTGVTGMRNFIDPNISNLSNYIKSQKNKFIMVGFGISNCLQASFISKWNIDGIVVGSAFINILSTYSINHNYLEQLGCFCKDLKMAITKSD
uniref:Tryptophan synthase alpha chain n=1 Tax=Haraldiophyllum bonnemaisonii TaxID=167977 RepID=A0A4D6WWD0_9FLOR|nr:Tryptophan synthase alpha subunit [Haraldiophyllum bonnemaisonii]